MRIRLTIATTNAATPTTPEQQHAAVDLFMKSIRAGRRITAEGSEMQALREADISELACEPKVVPVVADGMGLMPLNFYAMSEEDEFVFFIGSRELCREKRGILTT